MQFKSICKQKLIITTLLFSKLWQIVIISRSGVYDGQQRSYWQFVTPLSSQQLIEQGQFAGLGGLYTVAVIVG